MIKSPFHWQRNKRSLEFEILDANNTVVAQIDSGMSASHQEAGARAITNALNAWTPSGVNLTGNVAKDGERRLCDMSKGDAPCRARLYSSRKDYLCCRFVLGHAGPHQTVYDNGDEWDEDVSSLVPSQAVSR